MTLGVIDLNTAVIVAVAVIVGIFALIRSRSDTWKSNYEASKVHAEQLAVELQAAQTELAHLRTLPSIEKLYDLMVKHDAREDEVWSRVSLILNQIADRIDNGSTAEKRSRL